MLPSQAVATPSLAVAVVVVSVLEPVSHHSLVRDLLELVQV